MDEDTRDEIANLYGLCQDLRSAQTATRYVLAGMLRALDDTTPAVRTIVENHLNERFAYAKRMTHSEDDEYDLEMTAIEEIEIAISRDRRDPL